MADRSPEIDVLMTLVRQRYGDRLTPAQLDDVRGTVQRIVTDVGALRAVKLAASDEPVPVFVPFRADDAYAMSPGGEEPTR